MKRRDPLKQTMTQFSYDHQNIEAHFRKLRQSAKEAAKALENLGGKKQKDEEK